MLPLSAHGGEFARGPDVAAPAVAAKRATWNYGDADTYVHLAKTFA
ncbi:hypothetical protein [Bradyrhizobium genosp. A]